MPEGKQSDDVEQLSFTRLSDEPVGKPFAGKESGDPHLLSDRSLCIALGTASGFFLLLLCAPMLRGKTFITGDLLWQNFPYLKFYADSLRHHDSVLWCPNLYGGYYLFGEGQAGMMHPLHLLLYSMLPLKTAFGLDILATYVFLLSGSYLLLGKAWKLSAPAALFGGFLFAFGGENITLLRHMNEVAVIAHLPWLLLAIDRVFESQQTLIRELWLIILALLTGSQLLLGHPQSVYFSVLVEGGYAVYLMTVNPRWSRLLRMMGAQLVGLMLGAVQLLPTRATLDDSVRAAPTLDFLADLSLQPQELLQWINPLVWHVGAYNQQHGPYNFFIYGGGIVTLLLFIWLLTQGKGEGARRKLVWFLGLLGAAGLFLALGKYNLLFRFYAGLPIINLFRGSSRYIILTDFALAAGAALALDRLRKLPEKFSLPPFLGRLAAAVGALSLATLVIVSLPKLIHVMGLRATPSLLSELLPHFGRPPLVAFGALLVTAEVIVVLASRRAPWIAGSGFVLIAVLDVMLIQGFTLLYRDRVGDPFQMADLPPVAAPGPIQAPDSNNVLLLAGYRLVNGFSGLQPASPIPMGSPIYARIMSARATPIDISTGGGWQTVPDPLPALRLRSRSKLLENRQALLADTAEIWKSSLLSNPRIPPDLERNMDQINHFDFSTAALVEVPVSLDSGATGSLRLTEDRPGRMEVVTDSTGTMLATLGVRFHPGWKITLDGKPQSTLRVDGNLLGFTVEAGHHVAECRFDPADFRYGARISTFALVGILLYLAILFLMARETRRYDSPAPRK